jgi:hypothetical protein
LGSTNSEFISSTDSKVAVNFKMKVLFYKISIVSALGKDNHCTVQEFIWQLSSYSTQTMKPNKIKSSASHVQDKLKREVLQVYCEKRKRKYSVHYCPQWLGKLGFCLQPTFEQFEM